MCGLIIHVSLGNPTVVQCDYKWGVYKGIGGDMCVFSCWLCRESFSFRHSVQFAGCI